MSAFVSTQFEGGYPRPLVSIRTLDQRGDSGIVCRKGPRDVMQHPSSTQIQAIQVSQSPIGSIRGLYGEQGLGSSQFGQYTIQPAGKERWFHQTSHQGRCTERCREKILSAGLKMQRVVTIVSEKGNRPLGDQGSGPGSPHRTRPVIDQTEREGGLIVGAGAHRSTKFFEPTGQIGRRHRDQWLQACLPSCGRLRTHERKFVGECQHPSQAVGSLEGGVRVQVLCFALEGLFIELLFEQLMTTGSGVPVAQKATSSNEKPVRVRGGLGRPELLGAGVRRRLPRARPLTSRAFRLALAPTLARGPLFYFRRLEPLSQRVIYSPGRHCTLGLVKSSFCMLS